MHEKVAARLLEDHRSLLEDALSCADAVAAGWEGETTTDRAAVVGPYRATLERAELLAPLVSALSEAVSAAGGELIARPVPDVPYLAITGQGIVLRGPIADGRIVVTIEAFEVDPYRRGPPLPAALVVEERGR